jgi:glycerol-3-phosphate dehydrogenase
MQDGAMLGRDTRAMVAPSQGVHLVVEREFMPSRHALMIPHTADGRVLFAVPWLGKLILGTTDTPRADLDREPRPFGQEVRFILDEAAKYLNKAPTRADVRSVWVGLRPLVKPRNEEGKRTQRLSREHTVLVSRSGLVTVTGGKWTTYRAMAEDVLEKCVGKGLLESRPAGQTENLRLVGASAPAESAPVSVSKTEGPHSYGDEHAFLGSLPGADVWLADGLSEAMVRFAARYEYAITVEDMLARRSRMLFLDARLAAKLADRVAEILHEETGLDPRASEFAQLATQYLQVP